MLWIWIGFVVFVLLLLALDLGVFNRKAHVVSMKEALGWSGLWISLGLLFSVFVYYGYEKHWMGLGLAGDSGVLDQWAIDEKNPKGELDGKAATVKYLLGYVIEKSLSVDNIFVIAIIFGATAVPAIYQHRVLFWGILGALLMRGVMIGVGATLIERFNWILYVFAAFLIFTAVKMFFAKSEGEPHPSESKIITLTRRFLPVTQHFHGEHFIVRAGSKASKEAAIPEAIASNDPKTDATQKEPDAALDSAPAGKWFVTPLFVALVVVEFTDLIFAVDSIPAIYAITTDPFLVFTSNVFAILGLRSLYFALAGLISKFRYLKPALAIVLLVVGIKMLLHKELKAGLGEYYNLYMLATVLLILTGGVVLSLMTARKDETPAGV